MSNKKSKAKKKKSKPIKSLGKLSIINAACSGGFAVSSSANYWRLTSSKAKMATTVEVRFSRSFVLTPQITYGITSIKHGMDDKFEVQSAVTNLNPAGFDVGISITRSPQHKVPIRISYSWMAVGVVPEVPKIYYRKPG